MGEWLAGSLSIADFIMYEIFKGILKIDPSVISKFPKLQAW